MPDISNITLGEENYSIKDTIAREKSITNESNILNLNNEVNRIKKRRFIFIGDSYAVPTVTGGNNWIDKCISELGLTSDQYYIARQGSVGFLNLVTETNNFLSLLLNLSSTITDKDSITDIIICGGVNDSNGTTLNIEGAINQFMDYVKTYYVNATVRLGCISRTTGRGTNQKIYEVSLPAYKSITKFGGVYLNGVEFILHEAALISADAIHPIYNGLGNDYLALGIAQAIKSGSVETYRHKTVTITPSGRCNNIANLDTKEQFLNNNVCEMILDNHFLGSMVRFDISETTLTTDSYIELATIDDGYILTDGVGSQCNCLCHVRYRSASAVITNGIGYLTIADKRLFFKPCLEATPTSYGVPIENVSYIEIYEAHFYAGSLNC